MGTAQEPIFSLAKPSPSIRFESRLKFSPLSLARTVDGQPIVVWQWSTIDHGEKLLSEYRIDRKVDIKRGAKVDIVQDEQRLCQIEIELRVHIRRVVQVQGEDGLRQVGQKEEQIDADRIDGEFSLTTLRVFFFLPGKS